MRRKSERTASKKGKASPEKKVEKVKRTRTRRRKQSSSTENESADEGSPVREVESAGDAEKKPPVTPAKEDSPEEAQDQVWRVKTTEASGDIKKLKICLTRPPSTPERVDRSPRSKRKHSRATSSSDTPSVEGVDEKKKTRHRSKRLARDSKEESEKTDSHGEEAEHQDHDKSSDEVTQSETVEETETPMSTTNEETKVTETENLIQSSQEVPETNETPKVTESQDTEKASDADTTVASPKDETRVASPPAEPNVESNTDSQEVQPSDVTENKSPENKSPEQTNVTEKESPVRQREESVEKSEVLELHAEDSKCESSDNEAGQSKEEPKDEPTVTQEETTAPEEQKVSTVNEESISKDTEKIDSDGKQAINEPDVVESSDKVAKETNEIEIVTKPDDQPVEKPKDESEPEPSKTKEIERQQDTAKLSKDEPTQIDTAKLTKDEPIANGQTAPVAVGRKRRWGSRSSKLTTQKSITISTDVLKDIIPDVKPVEFDEVIEEKKHKRSENQERIERPVLPKIIIDNTENVELKKESDEKERDPHTPKPRDLASNRKISIIKDSDSIIARPPSPPRNKQSCILYITNLVRPFTLPQLKNLLQRTGRITENGFWIDRIKSKCFVQYETEDQAVETRHALHGVTWPVSNPKTLQVDFSTQEAFDKAKVNEDADSAPVSTIPGTVEDWLREQDMKRERGELEKPWERKAATREWDLGKNDKDKDKDNKLRRDERPIDKRRHRSPEKSPEPARKFKKKEEEAPAKLLDDLFRKTKTTPCIYWLPLSAETIAIKEEQRRQHMAEHERRLQELRRTHRRH
uniref:RRM domain-containing protein n=1 Tax=Heliothis virescens TaxID=7102 RepID=A0A2A4JEB9_HELVI